MGRDKARLPLASRTLLARTIDTLAPVCDDIQVVGYGELPADCPPVRLTADIVPNAGPLGGLHAGLLGARHELVICAACDYPFLSAAVVRLLLTRAAGHDAAVPRARDTEHVLQAVYARRIVPGVEARLQARMYRLRDLLGCLDVAWIEEEELRAIDPDLRSLLNVNTPEEWERARALGGEAPR